MHLIKLHIENFGGLSDFTWSLSEGINEIVKDNGWGKSTLGTFIRVMFYGFLDDRRRNPWENDRKKNAPFHGGLYGGSVDFEKGGRIYHLERTFGTSGTKEDTFKLFDARTGRKSASYTATTLGKGVFGIDGVSFENTLFITAKGCVSEVTGDIHARLTDTGREAADLGNFDDVKQTLHRAINERGPRYNGRLRSLEASLQESLCVIGEKEEARARFEALKNQERQLRGEVRELEKRRESIKADLKRESLKNDQKAERATWESLKTNVSEAEEKVQAAESAFPGGVPDAVDLKGGLETSRALEKEKRILKACAVSEEEKRFLTENTLIPTDVLEAAEEKSRRLDALERENAEAHLSESEAQSLLKGRAMFGEQPLLTKDLRERYSIWQKSLSKKEALEIKKAALLQMKKKKISPLLYAGLGVSLIGAALLIVNTLIGGLIFLAGVISLLLGRRMSGNNPAYEKLREEIRRDERFIHQAEKDTEQFLKSLGIPFDPPAVSLDLQILMEKNQRYAEALKKQSAFGTTETGEMDALRDAVGLFQETYGLEKGENRALQMEKLKRKNDTLCRIQRKAEEEKKREASIVALEERLLDFGKKWQIPVRYDDLFYVDLLEKKTRLEERQRAQQKALKDLQSFESRHGSCREGRNEEGGSLQDIQAASESNLRLMEEKKDAIRKLFSEIDEAAEHLTRIRSAEDERHVCLQEKARLEKEIWILKETEKCLDQARDKFLLRYQGAIRRRFHHYIQVITGEAGDGLTFDADLNVTFTKDGGTRHFGFLSDGQKDLVSLAKRLAFIDAMYEKEGMILLLDDPLSALDDKNLEGAKALLREASKKHQVISLTCTKTRRL